MLKQHFYIVAHNPNTFREAKTFLQKGANALEPDIHVNTDGTFYVSHGSVSNKSNQLSLKTYLERLRRYVTTKHGSGSNKKYPNLALINFDVKDTTMNLHGFLNQVHEHFTSQHRRCAGVAILVTYSSTDAVLESLFWLQPPVHIPGGKFLRAFKESWHPGMKVGVGIDEDDNPGNVLKFFKAKPGLKRITYGNGIFVAGVEALNKSIYRSISEAKFIQATKTPNFKMIGTWTLASSDSLRAYLDLHMDYIIVNISTVKQVAAILKESWFKQHYTLAQNGHDPWTAPRRPTYAISVKTRDVSHAGTDSVITFTLFGSKGWVKSKVNSTFKGMMESGDLNHLTIEGKDVGTIKKIKVSIDGSGNAPGWLPQYIKVAKNFMVSKAKVVHFGKNEWVEEGSPVTKLF
jgi:hypothetical protein